MITPATPTATATPPQMTASTASLVSRHVECSLLDAVRTADCLEIEHVVVRELEHLFLALI